MKSVLADNQIHLPISGNDFRWLQLVCLLLMSDSVYFGQTQIYKDLTCVYGLCGEGVHTTNLQPVYLLYPCVNRCVANLFTF